MVARSNAEHVRNYYRRHATQVCRRKTLTRCKIYGLVPSHAVALKYNISLEELMVAFMHWLMGTVVNNANTQFKVVRQGAKFEALYRCFLNADAPDTSQPPEVSEKN